MIANYSSLTNCCVMKLGFADRSSGFSGAAWEVRLFDVPTICFSGFLTIPSARSVTFADKEDFCTSPAFASSISHAQIRSPNDLIHYHC